MSVQQSVRDKISQILKQPVASVRDDVMLTDLVRESFVLIELAIELQEDYDVQFGQDDLNTVRTVADVLELVANRAEA